MTIRVLQIVGGMNRGGAETWLMNLMRKIDPAKIRFDFFTAMPGPCAYDAEIHSLGGRVFSSPIDDGPVRYFCRLRNVLKNEGPYNAVHTHLQYFGGYGLLAAKLSGVPIRIAHSHTDTRNSQSERRLNRRVYRSCMKELIRFSMTRGLAVSERAAFDLFGTAWRSSPDRVQIHYCGIDLEPFAKIRDRSAIRADLGIPADAKVICHVGRFVEAKNHSFLLDVSALAMKDDPTVWLLLVGDGPLRGAMQNKARDLGLDARTIFTGVRTDVPSMLAASDVLFFPSKWEGLPLVLLEAQAATVPIIASASITDECDAAMGNTIRLSLDEPLNVWVHELHCAMERRRSPGIGILPGSKFDIRKDVHALSKFYGKS